MTDDPGGSPTPPAPADGVTHVLRLFVTGMTPRSVEAVARLKGVCERHLAGRYELEVIDVYQQPGRAKSEQIVATPTLIKSLPAPLRRLVGDLSDVERVLVGLDIRPLAEGGT